MYAHNINSRYAMIEGHRVSAEFYRELEGNREIHYVIREYEYRLGRELDSSVSLEEFYYKYWNKHIKNPYLTKDSVTETTKTTIKNKKILLTIKRKSL